MGYRVTKMATVKQSEFARLHGVTRNTITKWKARRWLVMRGDRVDVDASNARLKKYRRDGLPDAGKVTARVTRKRGETPNQAAERIALSVAPFDLDEARRIKENYQALLNQLEYDQRSGAVVAVQDVAGALGEQLSRVRTRLLAIPSECATRVLVLKTAAEAQEVLRAAVTEALEELTGWAASRVQASDSTGRARKP